MLGCATTQRVVDRRLPRWIIVNGGYQDVPEKRIGWEDWVSDYYGEFEGYTETLLYSVSIGKGIGGSINPQPRPNDASSICLKAHRCTQMGSTRVL